jgi:mRNA-degrading endonuclease HigB of HigAB toxin-antitoxin module
MQFKLFLILFLISPFINAQETLSKIVVSKDTKKPVCFAHVYLKNNLKTGTITNGDGRFVLRLDGNTDTLLITHIAYEKHKILINESIGDTIFLFPKTESISEVTISALTPYSLMVKVIDNLKRNHFVEQVMYQMYGRIVIHNKDKSELHILSEQVTNVYYNKLGQHPFAQIVKLRIKPFSEIGERYFETMRMISNVTLFSDLSYIFSYNPVFNIRKLKKYYNIEILGETNKLIKIKCSPISEKYYKSILYIDKITFAISKIYEYRSNVVEATSFKRVKNKWYLSSYNSKYTFKSDTRWLPDTEAVFEEMAFFNISDKDFNSSFYPERQLIARKIEKYVGSWNDDFWENYNYIPLPDWIKQKIEEVK